MSFKITDEDAIALHLAQITRTDTVTLFSGFIGALRDARKFTLRDQDNGVKIPKNSCGDHGSWLGAIGYLALLDQIGTCFKPKGVATFKGNSISKALGYFTNLDSDTIDAIYALRCALAHDYSLLNRSHKHNLVHHFALHQSSSHPLVIPPKLRWDGNILNLTRDNVTYVNLEALGDCVEGIYQTLNNLSAQSLLEIELPGGGVELAVRYSIASPTQ